MSSRLNWIVPAVGSGRRMMVRPSVDLPQHDSQTRPNVSPFLISRSTPSTACTCAVVRCKAREATGNQVFSPRTDTSGSEVVQARLNCTAPASGTLEFLAGLGDPARGELRVADPGQRRNIARAALDLEGTAGMKRAAGREIDEIRREALDRLQRFLPLFVEWRDGTQQRPPVWVLGVAQQI